MAPIYEEIILSWEGKEYTVQPSYEMVQRIESGPRAISILGVCHRMWRGEPPVSLVAVIISHMLQSGGAKGATPAMVYGHLMRLAMSDGGGDEEWNRVAAAISTAFVPQEQSSGNSEGLVGDGADSAKTTTTQARI